MELRHYVTASGTDVIQEWVDGMRDLRARVAIQRRISRLILGNFGDHSYCRDGIHELRIDVGPGYRVYYARDGATVTILLCGADKRTQTRDVDRAIEYWRDYQRRR
ncbi:MAG: type II toxin-antitoxin system RelE/ParE family toxin [Gammaproteobacteria bacterium]|nr:type II toxin-antitoxin system RelE/ParE family toxin [Gammaproteobacteria bacterium]